MFSLTDNCFETYICMLVKNEPFLCSIEHQNYNDSQEKWSTLVWRNKFFREVAVVSPTHLPSTAAKSYNDLEAQWSSEVLNVPTHLKPLADALYTDISLKRQQRALEMSLYHFQQLIKTVAAQITKGGN